MKRSWVIVLLFPAILAVYLAVAVQARAATAVDPTKVTHFVLTTSTTTTAGTSSTVTVKAESASNKVVTSFHATVSFTSTDRLATLPGPYTFTQADKGQHTFSVALRTAGSETLTARDTAVPTIAGSTTIFVTPGPLAGFSLSGPTSIGAGTPFTETVTEVDAFGNTDPYTTTGGFSSTDSQATLPPNFTFTQADDGSHAFSITLRTAGSQTLTASDAAAPTITGSTTIFVTPGPLAGFSLSGPTSIGAGTPFTETVTEVDAFGNTDPVNGITVVFGSSDTQATKPETDTFTLTDAGVVTETYTLRTAGNQAITTSDTAVPTITGSTTILVTPGPLAGFSLSGPASIGAGTPFTETVTEVDAFGNTDPYTMTGGFSSTDSQASLPEPYTFTQADDGSHAFSVTLRTAGSQTLTARDTAAPTIAGSTTILVTPGPLAGFSLSGPTSIGAGTPFTETVTEVDAFGNTDPVSGITTAFTDTDPLATRPVTTTYTLADDGVVTETYTLRTAGTQAISATVVGAPTIGGTATVSVTPGPLAALSFTAPITLTATAGITVSSFLREVDAFGNTTPSVTTVTFGSSDSRVTLPPNYTFTLADNGIHTFPFILFTAGSRTLTATVVGAPSIAGSTTITVLPGPLDHFAVGAPATDPSGTAITVFVTAQDAYNNTVTSYTGNPQVTCTDPSAEFVPASLTFTSSNKGVVVFTMIPVTPGSTTLTVTDTNTGATGKAIIEVT
jgi:hypothetical protein